jgi:hypothetical protein
MRCFLIIAMVPFAGCAPAPSDKPGPFSAEELGMSVGDQEAKLLTEVAAYAFWQVPVTESQASDLVDKMRAEYGEALFLIDDQCRVSLRRGTVATVPSIDRRVEANMADYHARPSRVRLLMKLKTELERQELLTR